MQPQQSYSYPAGWYYAQGDPANTVRYWDGASWASEPQQQNPGFISQAGQLASPWQRLGPGSLMYWS